MFRTLIIVLCLLSTPLQSEIVFLVDRSASITSQVDRALRDTIGSLGNTPVTIIPWNSQVGTPIYGIARNAAQNLQQPVSTTWLGGAAHTLLNEDFNCKLIVIIVHGQASDYGMMQMYLPAFLRKNTAHILVIPEHEKDLRADKDFYRTFAKGTQVQIDELSPTNISRTYNSWRPPKNCQFLF